MVVREPDSGELAIKRVAAGPGDRVPFADGYLILAEDEAWLLADADEETARAPDSASRSTRDATGLFPWTCWSGGRGSATGRCGGSARSGTGSGQIFAPATESQHLGVPIDAVIGQPSAWVRIWPLNRAVWPREPPKVLTFNHPG